jgi:hypothetical protein
MTENKECAFYDACRSYSNYKLPNGLAQRQDWGDYSSTVPQFRANFLGRAQTCPSGEAGAASSLPCIGPSLRMDLFTNTESHGVGVGVVVQSGGGDGVGAR